MSAPPLIAPGRARRRAGGLLLGYGVAGLLLMGTLFLATLAVGIMGRDGFTRVDETIDEVVAVLDSTAAALRAADTTLAGVGVSLQETAGVVAEAAVLGGILSDGATTLADQAGSIGILGQYPFEGLETPLREAGDSLDRLATQLTATGVALTDNAEDLDVLAARLGAVAVSLDASRERLTGVDTQLGGAAMLAVGVVLAIIAWLALPALAALWLGRRWRRENPRD